LGFEPIGVQVLTPRLAADRYRDQAAVNAYFGRAIEILAATPNVQAVGAVDMVPFGGSVNKLLFAAPEGRAIRLETRFVAGDYFRAMDFQMLSGRSLDGARLSTDARVAVLTQNAARALFGTAGSIGRTLLSEDFGDLDVVGVVNDIRNGPELTPDLGVFLPASAVSPLRRIVARVSGKSTGVDELIRGLTLIDPTTIVSGGRLLNEVSSLLVTQRLQAVVLGAAAAAVLLLVASGIYAVVAFCAETSRRETAVRLALGARPATLRLRYVTLALQGGLLGAVVGLGAAAATLALLDHVLYGAPQANVLLYVGSALACVALAGATAAAAVWKCTVEQGLQALLRD
jgi:ABC-type antimicrobial peptide transport system permease subunit